jgi:hypothetical protein
MMFSEFLDTVLLPTLYSVLVALVTTLATVAISAIRRWGQKQKAEWISKVLEEAAAAADRAVAMVNQVYAEKSRAEGDGKLTAFQAKEAMRMAIDAAMEQLGADGLKQLAAVAGNDTGVMKVLHTMVESAVSNEKLMRESSTSYLAR